MEPTDLNNHEANTDESNRIQSIIFNILIFIMIVSLSVIITRVLWWFDGPHTMLSLAYHFYAVGVVVIIIGVVFYSLMGIRGERVNALLAFGFSSKHPGPVSSSSKFNGPSTNRESKTQSPIVEMKKQKGSPIPILICCAGAVCIIIGGLIHLYA